MLKKFMIILLLLMGTGFFSACFFPSHPACLAQPVQSPANQQTVNTQSKQGWFMNHFTQAQQSLNKEITGYIRALKKQHSIGVLVTALGVSFAYGVLHAVGPGHGKTIITGWILSQTRTLRDIILVSGMATVLHAFSSVAVVLGIYFVVGKFVPGTTDKINSWFQLAAGVMLVLMGLDIIIRIVRERLACRQATASLPTTVTEGFGSSLLQAPSTHPALIALAIGIVPCPLAGIILIFSLVQKMMWEGLLMVSFFALGMGVSVFVIAVSVWLLKNKVTQISTFSSSQQLVQIATALGGIFFVVFGVFVILPYLA